MPEKTTRRVIRGAKNNNNKQMIYVKNKMRVFKK